jgi:chromosome segregation ATPase
LLNNRGKHDRTIQIESLRKSQQVLNRSVVQREEQIALLTTDRDTWKQRAQTAETGKDRSAAQTMHFELQEKYAQSQVQLADSNRERITLQDFLSAATNDLNGVRKQLAEAQTAREEATTRLTYITRELELTKQTAARRESDLQQTARDTSTLRMECDELREGLQRATAKAETLQRLRDEAQALLDARSAELSEAQSALARLQAESGAAFGGSDVEAQLREDRGRLQSRVKELEAAALM